MKHGVTPAAPSKGIHYWLESRAPEKWVRELPRNWPHTPSFDLPPRACGCMALVRFWTD